MSKGMEATRPREPARAAVSAEPGDQIFRKYYTDKDYITSLEGVLKVLSAVSIYKGMYSTYLALKTTLALVTRPGFARCRYLAITML